MLIYKNISYTTDNFSDYDLFDVTQKGFFEITWFKWLLYKPVSATPIIFAELGT